jgi:hypothetical protein
VSTTSPLARSLPWLRRQGWTVDVVERRLPFCRVTKDAFGIIDAIGVRTGEVAGFQVTSRSNLAARRKKALAAPGLRPWLGSGARFFLVAWAKAGPRGKRKVWQPVVQELTLADLPASTPA